MKIANSISLLFGFLIFIVPVANAEQEHRTPDAPLEYLKMENPIDYKEVDERFLKRTARLYKRRCQKCHGETGDGKGPNAESIEIKPAAFSTPGYLGKRRDGQLFWIMVHGSEGTEMVPVGPGSDVGLNEEELWQLIAYLRSKFTN